MLYISIFLVLLFVMIGVSILIGKGLVDQLTSPKRCDVELERSAAITRGEYKKEDFEYVNKKSFSVINKRGERLDGEIFFCEVPTNKVCIACHGWTSNRIGMYKYVRAILDNHFHVIVYDHTNCGSSEGIYGTMGKYESDDLSDVVDFAKDKFGSDCKILTYGESMGAVTVLINMTNDVRIYAVVADCPFFDLEAECYYLLAKKKYLFKKPIIWVADRIFKKRVGIRFRNVSPYQAIINAGGVKEIPLLLVHGEEDDFILPLHSEKIKSIKKGYVKLYHSAGAPHARSILVNPEEYREVLAKYLADIFAK